MQNFARCGPFQFCKYGYCPSFNTIKMERPI